MEKTGTKSVDNTCRNHGTCKYCEENRTRKNKKRSADIEEYIKEEKEIKDSG